MSNLVYCEKHNPRGRTPAAHEMVDECEWPHEVAPDGREPSMTATETLDPRDAL